MFPLAFVFLAVGLLAAGNFRRAAPRVMAALALFLLLAAPLVWALSRAKGRVTFGDTGRLNFLWFVNQIRSTHWPHWHGEGPGGSIPQHPARKVCEDPAIYEFGTPVGGTYPMWYDPSYWYEGVTPRVDLGQQAQRLLASASFYYDFFFFSPQAGLLLGLLVLYLMGGRWRLRAREVVRQWVLLVPAAAAMGMYALVYLEARYIGPFVVLFWFGVLSSVTLPDCLESRKLVARVAAAMTALLLAGAGASTVRDLARSREAAVPAFDGVVQWRVAVGLQQLGVRPGDRVAVIGSGMSACRWARLARVRIVAELPWQDRDKFWTAEPHARSRILELFAAAGAKVVVAEEVPGHISTAGWQRVGDAGHYAFLLPR